MPSSSAELLRALAVLCEPPESEHDRIGQLLALPGSPDPADHTRLFVLELYPYASVHLGAEGMLGGEARDRVAGFWRAVGRRPPPEPDHLAALLGLYAALCEEEVEGTTGSDGAGGEARRRLRRRAREALLWEHLLSWLGPWLFRVAEIGSPFYRAWASRLLETLREDAAALGPPGKLPLHLREAPVFSDPSRAEGAAAGDDFLHALLAPVRSGLLLTRSDLERAGRVLELGVRVGERRFALRALLSQAPGAVLDWLAEEARHWERVHAKGWILPSRAGNAGGPGAPRQASVEAIGPVASWWRERAGHSAALLEGLADRASVPLES